MTGSHWRGIVAAMATVIGVGNLDAQTDSVTVVPGAQYRAGDLQSWLLGDRYRELWTTPIRVPVLNLDTLGGLTAVRTGGFRQTRSLRLEGPDGREYNFRSVDKELSPAMPEFARETVADWVRQDLTSAQLPEAPVVAGVLLDAAGVLHPGPQLFVLPDDPRLEEFREEYAGMLGTFEVHPDEGPNDEPWFAGAERVAGTDRLLEHLREDVDHFVDSEAFVRARLMDVYFGDFDRHGGQWRWARYDRDGAYYWEAIPEDRDYAFVEYDGEALTIARQTGLGRLVRFDPHYPDLMAMVDNSLEFTRRLSADLELEDWMRIADDLTLRLSDDAIDRAIDAMPPEHAVLVGDELRARLIERRDRLPAMARDFYRLISAVVDVHGTEEDDRVEIERIDDQNVRVRLHAGDFPRPRFERVLHPDQTNEIRIFLDEGDDVAVVRGSGAGINVRVVGGDGDDRLIDESTGPTFFYDAYGNNEFVRGERTAVDRRPWRAEMEEEEEGVSGDDDDDDAEVEDDGIAADAGDLLPGEVRDWGYSGSRFVPIIGWESHAQLILGAEAHYTSYEFRYDPMRARVWVRGLVAPLEARLGAEVGGDLYRSNSTAHLRAEARVSNLRATVFHGLGNDTPPGPTSDLRIWHREAVITALGYLIDEPRFSLAIGPRYEHLDPEAPDIMLPLPTADLEGVDRAGGVIEAAWDGRDNAIDPQRGARLAAAAVGYPGGGPTDSSVGWVEGSAAAFLPAGIGTLALRAGGKAVRGAFAYYDAAFLGGNETLRGYHHQRFAGDTALYGGAELRVPLVPAKILVRGLLGISAFMDAGRVWVGGASDGGWHAGIGGGPWFRIPIGAVSAGYAYGEESRFYFRLGMPF